MTLETLDASDMLDVIHFMLERDFIGEYAEASDVRDRARTFIYEDLYKQPYAMKQGQRRSSGGPADADGMPVEDYGDDNIGSYGNAGSGSVITPGGGQMSSQQGLTSKPYIPPTDMDMSDNPFQPFAGLNEQPQF